MNDNKGALSDFNKVIRENPKHYKAIHNRGLTKASLQDYDGALTDFDKSLEIDPRYADAYYDRGIIKIKVGQKETGFQDLKKAAGLGHAKAKNALQNLLK